MIEKVQQLVAQGYGRGRIAKALGISEKKARTLIAKVKDIPRAVHVSKEESEKTLKTDGFFDKIYTAEQMAKFHSIDLNIWKEGRMKTNYWEVGVKIGSGDTAWVTTHPLHQITIWWERRLDNAGNLKEILMSQMKLPDFVPQKINTLGDLSVEMMITDHHFGKIGFNPDTMDFNWSLKEAGKAYNDAVDFFLSQINLKDVSEFVLPTGNDLLNIDSSLNTTTKGTPQMTGDFWASVFRYSKETVIAVIEKLAKIAPVYAYFIPGNHDFNSVFSLGEAVHAYFQSNPNVVVTNNVIKRHYHVFGKNLTGYAHGNGMKPRDAYNAMTQDEPTKFGAAKFRKFRLGHLHQNKINKIVDLAYKEEVNGVDVEICPSLAPVDEWHYQNVYIGNLRRSKCFVAHKELGVIKEIYFNL